MKPKVIYLALSIVLLSSSFALAEEQLADLAPVTLDPIDAPPAPAKFLPAMAQKKRTPLAQPTIEEQIKTLRSIPGGTNLIDNSQFQTGRSSTI